jgi:hypothetical protein
MAYKRTTAVAASRDYHFTFSNTVGFFMQDEAGTDPDSFDYVGRLTTTALANDPGNNRHGHPQEALSNR